MIVCCSYIGHLYVAEAQVALDRISYAIDHLNADLLTDISTVYPEQKQDSGEIALRILFQGHLILS